MWRLLAEGWQDKANRLTLRPIRLNCEGICPMFVRAVWRLRRLVDIKQTVRETNVPSTRNADLLGLTGADFPKMTRSLFDR